MMDADEQKSRIEAPSEKNLQLKAYFSRWWNELVHFNGPTWRTLRSLMACPGRLAADECDRATQGKMTAKTVHPIRLYLTINIIFFFIGPWVNTGSDQALQVQIWHVEHATVVQMQPYLGTLIDRRIEASGTDDPLYRAIFDHQMKSQQGAVVFIVIPILGLAGFLAYRRRRRPYLVEHLILATNLTSFFLVSLLIVSVGARAMILLPKSAAMIVVTIWMVAWILWLPTTFYRSLRAFHELKSRWLTALLTAWSFSAFIAAFAVYLQTLFLWTLFNLRGLSLVVP